MKSLNLIIKFSLVVSLFAVNLNAQDELTKKASWTPSSAKILRDTMNRHLASIQLDELKKAKIDAVLSDENIEMTGDHLESFTDALAIVEPKVIELVESLREHPENPKKPKLSVLDDEKLAPVIRNNVSLAVGRWLAQNRFYDEAKDLLGLLKTGDVVDPGTLLFYRALVDHRLFEKNACLKTIDRLYENESSLPRRYTQISRLMQNDIKAMKAESLDHAARIMDDINRRISLNRSGKRVIGQEKRVIDMLDKIIEELEKQQQQQQGSSTNPSSPMQDSRIAGGKGDGRAQSKNYGEGGEWGDLPPAKRAEAMAEISKNLPPHYRQVIEEYFRKLAEDDDK